MSKLSPSAQAVLAIYEETWSQGYGSPLASALRAVAEEVVIPMYQYADWEMADLIMQEIQAIADELEAQ